MNKKFNAEDIESIEKESQEILDKFSKALEKVSGKDKEENFSGFYLERELFERIEGEGQGPDENFKKDMLENAPMKDDDFILTEKGEWK